MTTATKTIQSKKNKKTKKKKQRQAKEEQEELREQLGWCMIQNMKDMEIMYQAF
jgi:hypothetical protein